MEANRKAKKRERNSGGGERCKNNKTLVVGWFYSKKNAVAVVKTGRERTGYTKRRETKIDTGACDAVKCCGVHNI